jgi:hypothetical protein
VHTYDAQLAAGAPQPVPAEVALDGVEEFLFTCVATPSAWPHKPTAFDFHAGEDSDAAGASIHGTASELVLYLYDRIKADSLHVDGDAGLLDLLRAWEPEE